MTTGALPGGYRVQIVARTDDTPPEIEGEWAVHCTLCKHVDWVETHAHALTHAHSTHPATDRHQKWIGRVLVGGDLTGRRGYHCHRVDRRPGNPTFRGVWHPGVVPTWVHEQRARGRHDEMSTKRDERALGRARRVAAQARVDYVDVGEARVTLSTPGHDDRIVPAAVFEVRVAGARVARIHVLGDGRCFHKGRLIGSVAQTHEHFVRAAGGSR